jgi:hypothetical protein
MKIEFLRAGEEEQFTEMLENATEVIREALSALEGWGARPELVAKLRTVWFELHRATDPECSCADCQDDDSGRQEPGGLPFGRTYRASMRNETNDRAGNDPRRS